MAQNHTWTFWYIWRLKTKFLRFQDENKYDAHRVRNFIVLPIFMFSIIFTWNCTPFWPKKLFLPPKLAELYFFPPLYLCTQHPHIFICHSETLCWLVKLNFENFENFISRWNGCNPSLLLSEPYTAIWQKFDHISTWQYCTKDGCLLKEQQKCSKLVKKL